MVYLVSNDGILLPKDIVKISVEESLEKLNKINWLSLDTETTGLDRFQHKIVLLQLGDTKNQYVIDTTNINIQLYKDILETKNLIIQNAKFDLQFLYALNIVPRGKIWDTMLAEQVLFNGLNPESSLKALVKKYCKIELSKSERLSFVAVNYTLTLDAILYGALDIEYLIYIMAEQCKLSKDKEITKAIQLENEFVKSLAYIEFCGMHLNSKKWLEKADKLKPLIAEKKEKLDNIILTDKRLTKFIDEQLDLFSTELKPSVSYTSAKQMIPVFQALGLDLTNKDSKSGISINEKTISKYKHQPFVKAYLEYKKLIKDNTTYGEKFLNSIHPITKRLHSNYTQLQITGRISSSKPNLNNLPRDPITRACFEAEEDNLLIDLDYGDQEGRILANVSNEPNLIEMYNSGNIDGHSYVAKLCFPELKDVDIKDIKKKFPELRQKAKSARFAITFGGNGSTIANNLGVSKNEGVKVYKAYEKAFPTLFKHFEKIKDKTNYDGYILISSLTGRKVFHPNFFSLLDGDYEHYDFLKKALNYHIQGRAAEMIKIASILLFRWIIKNDYFNIVKIIGNVYDELIIEAPKELAEDIAKVAQSCMADAADFFAKIVPIRADYDISTHWVH